LKNAAPGPFFGPMCRARGRSTARRRSSENIIRIFLMEGLDIIDG
jgi:hypothetical protein